jgi:hypothetical protein
MGVSPYADIIAVSGIRYQVLGIRYLGLGFGRCPAPREELLFLTLRRSPKGGGSNPGIYPNLTHILASIFVRQAAAPITLIDVFGALRF